MKTRIIFLSLLLITSVCVKAEKKGVGTPEVHQLSKNVYAITDLFHTPEKGFTVNAGVILTKNSAVFIDAGLTINSAEFIWNSVSKELKNRKNIYFILTHYHSDHSFGMNFFKEKGAVIIEHKNTKEDLDQYKNDYKEFILDVMKLTPEEGDELLGDVKFPDPDIIVENDTILNIDGREIHILHTPGHIPGGISVYDTEDKILFAGDQMYEGSRLATHFGNIEEWKKWIDELKRFKTLNIDTICPGHGKLCGYDEVDRNITYLQGFISGFKSKARK